MKKTDQKASADSVVHAFKDLFMEASEQDLDRIISEVGEDPDDLDCRASQIINQALRSTEDVETTQSKMVERNLHQGLGVLVRMLRRNKGLSEGELADAADIEKNEVIQIECDENFSPNPRTIYQLEEYFNLPERTLVLISGSVTNLSKELSDEVVRFAANSKAIGKLSKEEKRLLNDFVKFLAKETQRGTKK